MWKIPNDDMNLWEQDKAAWVDLKAWEVCTRVALYCAQLPTHVFCADTHTRLFMSCTVVVSFQKRVQVKTVTLTVSILETEEEIEYFEEYAAEVLEAALEAGDMGATALTANADGQYDACIASPAVRATVGFARFLVDCRPKN